MNQQDIVAILSRANSLLEQGKPAETLRCLTALDGLLVDSEDRIEHGTLRSWALSEMGRVDEALDALAPLLREFPDNARLHGTRGVVLSNADALEEARSALERAVKLDRQDDVAVANLALVYEKMEDYGTALRLYDRAINLGADLDWALHRKATALSATGDYEAARGAIKRYLSLVPEDAEQWIALAILHSDEDEYEEAFACYRAAEKLDPDSPALRLNWGVTAVRAGRLKLARRQLKHLARTAAGSARTRLLRAFILEEEGKLAAAESCYEEALRLARPKDVAEMTYVLEMSLDFYARQRRMERCESLFAQAFAHDLCTVELCEAYREAAGEHVEEAFWFSLMVESDRREATADGGAGDRAGRDGARADGVSADGVSADDSASRSAAGDEPQRGRRDLQDGPQPRVRDVQDEPQRCVRNVQFVARDHDEAVAGVTRLLKRLHERHVRICEFVGAEPLEDVHVGVYEISGELEPANE